MLLTTQSDEDVYFVKLQMENMWDVNIILDARVLYNKGNKLYNTFDLPSCIFLLKKVHCSGSFQVAFLIEFFFLVWDDLVEFIMHIEKKNYFQHLQRLI